jgi:hypothetical protein
MGGVFPRRETRDEDIRRSRKIATFLRKVSLRVGTRAADSAESGVEDAKDAAPGEGEGIHPRRGTKTEGKRNSPR